MVEVSVIRRALLKGALALTGDGLRRPVNAPNAAPIVPGVQPGNSTPIVRANQVIVFGPSGAVVGVYVYQPGTRPALGNPPIAWLAFGTKDPFGNTLPSTSGIAGSGTFTAGATVISTSGISGTTVTGSLIRSAASGRRTTLDANGDIKVFNASGAVLFWFNNADNAQFFYTDTGSVTQGALTQSAATVSGTDPFGNTYLAGIAAYSGNQNSNISGGSVAVSNNLNTSPGAMIAPLGLGGLSKIDSPQTGAGDLPSSIFWYSKNGSPTGAPLIRVSNPVIATDPNGPPEAWHAVTLPTGMTGTIRVKLLAEGNFAALDVNVTITSTLATANTYTGGSLPSASYYPTGQRQFPLSINQGTGTAPAAPRVNIPASGAIALNIPPFATAGNTCLVSGTIVYPLD